jgi:ferritin-like metal-binding protein YciE
MNMTDSLKNMVGIATLTSLHDLFVHGLKDMYHGEKQLLKALETMADSAASSELSLSFKEHRQETVQHVARLEQVFNLIGLTPETEACEAIQGLVEDGEELAAATEDGSDVRDLALMYAASAVEHYEMARYIQLADWAHALGYSAAAKLLEQTLKEEKATAMKLEAMSEDCAEDMAPSTPTTGKGTRSGGSTGARM